MQQFDKARVFLDEDFTAVEKFTVSHLHLIHLHSVVDLKYLMLEVENVADP